MPLIPEVDQLCFVCGKENPQGLHLRFEAADGRAVSRHVIRAEHQGYGGMAHGGIVAALLDEAMVYAAATLGYWYTTAEMTVRYVQPVPTGCPLMLSAEVMRSHRRLAECRAELRLEDGMLLASATGKLMPGRALSDAERQERLTPGPVSASGSFEGS